MSGHAPTWPHVLVARADGLGDLLLAGPAVRAVARRARVTVLTRPERPWRVPHVRLGDQAIECRDCRARVCPRPRHDCLAPVSPRIVVRAVEQLAPAGVSGRPGAPLR